MGDVSSLFLDQVDAPEQCPEAYDDDSDGKSKKPQSNDNASSKPATDKSAAPSSSVLSVGSGEQQASSGDGNDHNPPQPPKPTNTPEDAPDVPAPSPESSETSNEEGAYIIDLYAGPITRTEHCEMQHACKQLPRGPGRMEQKGWISNEIKTRGLCPKESPEWRAHTLKCYNLTEEMLLEALAEPRTIKLI